LINLKALELVVELPRCLPLATRLVATAFWLRATKQRRNSWLSEVHTDSEIQINQHNFQQSRQFSLHRKSVHCVYRWSSDNVHFSNLFPVFLLAKISNSNVTMKFEQLHHFLSQNVGGTKDIMSPPV